MHFDNDNTRGYTTEQIASANRQLDAWCELVGVVQITSGQAWTDDGEDVTDHYKRECARVLDKIEAQS